MPFRICKTFEIESGHMLSKHPEKCRFPHGHTRLVELVLEADELDENDMVCDFKAIKDSMANFLETLDHAMCVNTADPGFGHLKSAYGERVIGFENRDPTTEVMAKYIYDHLTAKLAKAETAPTEKFRIRRLVRVIKVRLWETSSSWAEYRAS